MKKILLSAMLLLGAGMAQAQLSVNYDGITTTHQLNVVTDGGSEDIGIYVNLNQNSLYYTGILSEINAYQGGANANYRHGIGVKGVSQRALDGNYGIYGYVPQKTGSTYNYGAAVYGTNTTRKILNGLYAGYFDGIVGINGYLNVSGNISGTILSNALPAPSLEAAQALSKPTSLVTEQIAGIHSGSFYLQEKEEPKAALDGDSLSMEQKAIETATKAKMTIPRKHYGLSADELEEVFPDLVYENEDGTKSINYVEMVPILVQAINELSAKVATLEGGEGTVRKVAAAATNADEMGENVQVLSLGQNRPNPFGTTTEVEVSVPESVQSAFVYVYDLQGKKVQQVDITARGKHSVQLNAADLNDGMFLYSLIADGKVVDTRRMIVEK